MTPRSAALLLICLLIAGCEKSAPTRVPTRRPPPREISPPPKTTVAPGDTLSSIATSCYGHAAFSRFLALLNQLPPDRPLAVGQTLETPPLHAAFAQTSLDPGFQRILSDLAAAWTNYHSVSPDTPDRDASLAECANAINEAVRTWRAHPLMPDSPNRTRPADAIDQFRSAAALILAQTTGKVRDDPEFDAMACDHFSLGFTYALRWARQPEN